LQPVVVLFHPSACCRHTATVLIPKLTEYAAMHSGVCLNITACQSYGSKHLYWTKVPVCAPDAALPVRRDQRSETLPARSLVGVGEVGEGVVVVLKSVGVRVVLISVVVVLGATVVLILPHTRPSQQSFTRPSRSSLSPSLSPTTQSPLWRMQQSAAACRTGSRCLSRSCMLQ
jgi:hypothetical protein